MRRPSPVLVTASATITAITISQISGLAKPDSASASAATGLPGLVTPVITSSAIARIDSAPSGIALPMNATMVPTNSASRCQALGETPPGTGLTNQISGVTANTTADGTSLRSLRYCIGSSRAQNGRVRDGNS